MAGTGDYDDNHQRAVPGQRPPRRHRDQGRRDCGNHACRLPYLGDGNRRRGLGLTVRESGLVGELEWFDAYCKLDNAPGAAEETLELIRKAEADAARKGVVGIRDYEMAENVDT